MIEITCKCGHVRQFRFFDEVSAPIRQRVLDCASKKKCPACDAGLADSMGLLPGEARVETNVCIYDVSQRSRVLR